MDGCPLFRIACTVPAPFVLLGAVETCAQLLPCAQLPHARYTTRKNAQNPRNHPPPLCKSVKYAPIVLSFHKDTSVAAAPALALVLTAAALSVTILSNANLRSSLTTATTRQYRGLVVHPGSLRHRGVRYPSTLKNRGFAK
eukprot:348783-Amorphochlora_amoeboformis.AAC.2